MMHIATILPGQWKQHMIHRYAVWVNRLGRAVGAELKKLPERPPPLPWPVRPDGREAVRQYNSGLFPKFPAKPKRRAYANTYVPHTIDLNRTRTEVYRPDRKDEDWLWRIKLCWDDPHPGEIEAVVDRGGILYLPHFRQVTIRLPLKAKICRKLQAHKNGQWVGECNGVKKLNAREQIGSATKWLLEHGQNIPARSAESSSEQPPQGRKRPSPLVQGGELSGRAPHGLANGNGSANGSSLAAHGSLLTAHSTEPLLTAHSPGVVAYQAKQAERERKAREAKLQRRAPLDGAFHLEGFYPDERWGAVHYESPWEKKQRIERWEAEEQEELEAIGFILRQWDRPYYGPTFQRDDAFDGYLLRRDQFGPDPWDFDWPEPRWAPYINAKWKGRRKPKRYPTVRDRLAKVKPSLRIVPTGKRSAELIVTRRLHELSVGIGEALNLARMIEGAIKYRDPVKPDRKPSWRQQLRNTVVHRPGGLLRWLVNNPIAIMESGEWIIGNGATTTLRPDFNRTNHPKVASDLSPSLAKEGSLARAAHPRANGEQLPAKGELWAHTLPQQYLGLIDRNWLTGDGSLFAATPAADFATSIEGFPVRLPIAVMPPASYERWRTRNVGRRRRRAKRRALRRCFCCQKPAPKIRSLPVKMTARPALFLRN